MIQGIAIYPLMIALLEALFPDNLVLAGGAWAILAFGDGFSFYWGESENCCDSRNPPNSGWVTPFHYLVRSHVCIMSSSTGVAY